MYTDKGQLSHRSMLEQYSPLVRRIAHHMVVKLPSSVQVDDLIQVGMMGLVEAVNRFEEGHGAQFETFASQRIRGAMLDELRHNDWMSRSDRKSQKDIESAVYRLEHRLGRPARDSEIANELGLTTDDYHQMLSRVQGTQILHIEDMHANDEDADSVLDRYCADTRTEPAMQLMDRRMRLALVEAIENLPEREQSIMSMYYEHDMNLKEIAAVLGITESRVCQLHSQSIARLRTRLREH